MSRLFLLIFSSVLACAAFAAADQSQSSSTQHHAPAPVWLALDAEFSLKDSFSAQAIQMGMQLAIHEINAKGGVLGGRPLVLETRDHGSMPARGIKNLHELASKPDLVAVFGGRFSPVILAQLPLIEKYQIPFFVPWAAADPVVDNGMKPNFVFRVSLRDSLAMPYLLEQAKQRGFEKIGLMLVSTSWGRSNFAAAQGVFDKTPSSKMVGVTWHHPNDTSLQARYLSLLDAGAQAIILVANDHDAAVLCRDIADLPPHQRLPIFAHWGMTGGNFPKQAGAALGQVDFHVVQTFSFYQTEAQQLEKFQRLVQATLGIDDVRTLDAPTGVAHAYDSVHLLAKAIEQAKTTDRPAIRHALERLKPHRGLVRHYNPAFTPTRHEALDASQLILVSYQQEGRLKPIPAHPMSRHPRSRRLGD